MAVLSGVLLLFLPRVFWVRVGIGIFFLLGNGIIVTILPLYLKTFSLLIEKDFLRLERGMVFHKIYLFPNTAVLTVTAVSTPFSALFGLFSVVFKAARKRAFMPELSRKETEKILGFLTENLS
ncbi:MAG: hypothetical protein IKI29_01355 [Clostridia bacterium]|nr:hypothetical protein [Clostridia bacterium]